MVIGILALQGDFAEHKTVLDILDLNNIFVRTIADLNAVDALVMPGGESTVMLRLMKLSGLDKEVALRVQKGMPVFGTCAGAILLSRTHLNVLDVAIDRNAYGAQLHSFSADLLIEEVGTVAAEFIRAPQIIETGAAVQVLATYGDLPVLVRQAAVLAATFHTETTKDVRLHKYFLEQICANLCVES